VTDCRGNAKRAETEVVRDALRIFPRLVRDAGYFLLEGSAIDPASARTVELYTRRNAYRRPALTLAREMIDAFVERGWVEREGRRWQLTEAGAAWLRRQQAGADPFREQHQIRDTELRDTDGGVKRPVLVNAGESPLGWLRRRTDRDGRPLINAEQFEAGERLRADFARGQLAPRVTASWDVTASSRRTRRAAPGGPESLSDSALAARQRVTGVLEAVGPELSGILIDVCCLLRGLEDAEKAQGWPRRSGKVVLQLALTRLARHYGLTGDTDAARRHRRQLRHWGSDDFRPTLERWV
jgi:hypothetical protein